MERLVDRLMLLTVIIVVVASLLAGLLVVMSLPATVQAEQTKQVSPQKETPRLTSDDIERVAPRIKYDNEEKGDATPFLPHVTATISLSPGIGFGPSAIGINPTTGYVYAANSYTHYWPDWESHDISILSGTKAITTIQVPERPIDIVVNATSGYVYAVLTNDEVTVLSGTQVITTILGVGGTVSTVNLTSNLVYMAKSESREVTVLSGTNVVTTVTVSSNIRGIGAALDSSLVYVTAFTNVFGTLDPPGIITVLSGTQVITTISNFVDGPRAIIDNPVNGYLYVANDLTDTVTILSGTQTVATIPLNQGDSYWAQLKMEVNPTTGYVYVMGYQEDPYNGFIAVLSNTQLVKTFYNVTAPTRPTAMAINPVNGRVYVTYRLWPLWSGGGYYTSTMLILDGADAISWVDIEGDPSAVAANPENGHIYVANRGVNGLGSSVIVLSDVEVIAVIRGRGPTIAAVNSNGSLVYVADPVHQSVTIIQDGQIVDDVSMNNIHPQDLAVHPLTGLSYMTGVFIPGSSWGNGTVSVLRGSKTITKLNVTGNPSTIEIAPTNGYVYILNGSNNILVLSNTQIITRIETKTTLSVIKYNPVNGYVYADYDGGLSILNETQVITHIEINDYDSLPRFIEVNPLNGYVYAVGYERLDNWDIISNVWLVSGTQVITHIIVEGEPSALTVNPVNGFVYIASFISKPGDDINLLSVISGTQVITQMIVPAQISNIAANPVSGYVYVAGWDNTISVLSGTEVIKTLLVGDYPVDIAIDATAGLVYVLNYYGRSITVIADIPNFLFKLYLPLVLQ